MFYDFNVAIRAVIIDCIEINECNPSTEGKRGFIELFHWCCFGLYPWSATAKRVESLDYISNKVEYLFTSKNACGESSRDLFKMPSEALASAEGRIQKLRITLSLMANVKGRAGSSLPTRYAMLVAVVTVVEAWVFVIEFSDLTGWRILAGSMRWWGSKWLLCNEHTICIYKHTTMHSTRPSI